MRRLGEAVRREVRREVSREVRREVRREVTRSWRCTGMWIIEILCWPFFFWGGGVALLCPVVSLELQKRTLADARLRYLIYNYKLEV